MLNTVIIFNSLRFVFIRALFLICFIAIYITANAETLIGEAKHKNKTIYSENHEIVYLKNMLKSINSDYIDTKDVKIGFRQIDFPENHYMPNLVFKDELHNDTYSLTIDGLKGTLKSFIDGHEKTTEFNIEDDMVVTDSISKYIYDNFSLVMTEPKILKCLIPKSHRFVDIILKSEKSKNKDEAVFSLKPKSTFLSFFTSKTLIVYNIQNKQLKKYIGPSNLKDSKGKILKVEIDYE